MNGNHREFTWSRNTPFTARRLDYIFCDTNMSQHLITSDIKDFACTDHRAVMTNIHADNFPRGPSRWHFNSSHLRDKIFIDHMNAFIEKCLKEHKEENLDSRTSWEMLKASIRTECMEFGKKKRLKEKQLEAHALETNLKDMAKKIADDPNDINKKNRQGEIRPF